MGLLQKSNICNKLLTNRDLLNIYLFPNLKIISFRNKFKLCLSLAFFVITGTKVFFLIPRIKDGNLKFNSKILDEFSR